MFQLLLTFRYLTRRVMPLLAAVAVVLCTAMVLITWSVMGGFLNMLLDSGRSLVGDVSITWPTSGFAHYDDLIERLEDDQQIAAASPIIETFGMISLPDGRTKHVVIKGIDGPSYDRVTDYADSLYWRPLDEPLPKDKDRKDWRLRNHDLFKGLLADGKTLTERDPESGKPRAAVVLGTEVSQFNIRDPEGSGVLEPGRPVRRDEHGNKEPLDIFLPADSDIRLTVVPLDSQGRPVEAVIRPFPVANEFRTGLYEVDSNMVLVRLDALQKMLNLDAAERIEEEYDEFLMIVDPDTGELRYPEAQVVSIIPARVTTVLVRAVEGVDADAAKATCQRIYEEFAAEFEDVPVSEAISILTWRDQNRTMIAAVEKETALVLFIFSFISLTAVFLVLAIFWAMISEKTRDIGVLRSIGASRTGIASIWLAYGLVIVVVGSIVGEILAFTIVHNINAIHDWMGRAMGLTIWDPSVYYFTVIPNEVEPSKAAIVFVGGSLACLAGALWPAWRAANMDPVKALRFE